MVLGIVFVDIVFLTEQLACSMLINLSQTSEMALSKAFWCMIERKAGSISTLGIK